MSSVLPFNENVKPLFTLISYLLAGLFALSLFGVWSGYQDYSPIWLFRFLSLAALMMLSGFVLGMGCVVNAEDQSFTFHLKGLVWGIILVMTSGASVILLEPKVGVFLSGLLFLLLWQVELKTNMARVYPEWLWVGRTKLSMAIALCHMLLWLTVS